MAITAAGRCHYNDRIPEVSRKATANVCTLSDERPGLHSCGGASRRTLNGYEQRYGYALRSLQPADVTHRICRDSVWTPHHRCRADLLTRLIYARRSCQPFQSRALPNSAQACVWRARFCWRLRNLRLQVKPMPRPSRGKGPGTAAAPLRRTITAWGSLRLREPLKSSTVDGSTWASCHSLVIGSRTMMPRPGQLPAAAWLTVNGKGPRKATKIVSPSGEASPPPLPAKLSALSDRFTRGPNDD